MSNSKWIWHYGEYEIYHNMMVHLRREEQGYHRPAFWKIATPYPSIKFIKSFVSGDGYMVCYTTGNGCVTLDGVRYPMGKKISVSKGEHFVEIPVSKGDGLPAIFVDSDVCPSDDTWLSNYFAGEFSTVGMLDYFDTPDKNPEIFPFSYERKYPVAKKELGDGILFDFGVELFGYLNIINASTDEIGVYYGESEEEALDINYTYLIDKVSGSDNYRLKQRAFRYVYLTNASKSVNVSCDYEYLPLEKRGKFTCDDEVLNAVYDKSVYTFHLNCREGFFDGIKRDRWIWAGDAYQSGKINRYCFFDKAVEQRTLLGLIGKLPIEQNINTILDYSLLWIIELYEHYVTYGDIAFVSKIIDKAKALLDFVETRINADGFLEGKFDDWTFVDWSEMDKTGAICAEQMLLVKSYYAFGELLDAIGSTGREYTAKADILLKRVDEYYWDSDKGAYIDSYTSGKRVVTRHANIFAIIFDLCDTSKQKSILDNVLKNDNITKITTPYFKGYELDALAKLGEFGEVESNFSYWSDMLKLGATTIWEEYDPTKQGIEHYEMYGGKYEKSLCHAWGAGVIYLFGRYYLGVKATDIGYKTFTVSPNLGGLKSIKGVVPIVNGTVEVQLDDNTLVVSATRDGGTLIYKGKEYPIFPNEKIEIKA